jgi:hypothetical protein
MIAGLGSGSSAETEAFGNAARMLFGCSPQEMIKRYITSAAHHYARAATGTLNDLLYRVEGKLRVELLVMHRPEERPHVLTPAPISMFPGVFPTRSFNAQAVATKNGYLVLFDSLVVPIMDILSKVLFAKGSDDHRAEILAQTVNSYVNCSPAKVFEHTIDSIKLEYPEQLASELFKSLLEFVFCHEYGHCQRHLKDCEGTYKLLASPSQIEVIKRSHAHEFEADTWAMAMIYHRSNATLADDPEAWNIKFGAPIIFAAFVALLEVAFAAAGKKLADTHPSGVERLWVMMQFMNYVNRRKYMQLGNIFIDVADIVGKKAFGWQFDPPANRSDLERRLVEDVRRLRVLDGPHR